MGADDDQNCVEHVWRLRGVALIPGEGAPTEYECVRCAAVYYREPADPFPGTV